MSFNETRKQLIPVLCFTPFKFHNFLEIVVHILKLVLLGLKTIITNPMLELIGYEQRPIAALIKSLIISNLTELTMENIFLAQKR